MRVVGSFIVGILVIAFIVCLVIFGLQNQAIRGYSFLGLTFTFPVWAMVALAAAAGFILGLLVVTPARASTEAGHRAMRANLRRQERELTEMRAANEQLQGQLSSLQAEHGNVVRERDAYRTAVDTLRAPTAGPQVQAQPQDEQVSRQTVAYATPASADVGDGATEERRVTSESAAPDGATSDGVAAGTPVASGAATQTTQEPRPTFGDRLRTLFAKPEDEQTDVPPEGPTAPA